jgi:Tfp pilus assembly protein PilF
MRALTTVFLALSFCLPVLAQTGVISGQIVGLDGKPLAGVTVSIDRLNIRQHFEAKSDSHGDFVHTGIPTGPYEVSITTEGKSAKLGARVSFGGTSKLEFDLRRLIPYDAAQKHRVTTTGLTIPRRAQEEWQKAFDAKDNLEKAKKHLEKAIELAPDFEAALNDLGTIYHRRQQYAEAAALFERALKVNPESMTARVNLGGTLIGLKQYEHALAENLRVLTVRPNDALAHGQAGLALFHLQRYQEAISHLQHSKQSDPHLPLLPGFLLANVYDVLGNNRAAIAEYEDFLKMHPRYRDRAEVEARIRALR